MMHWCPLLNFLVLIKYLSRINLIGVSPTSTVNKPAVTKKQKSKDNHNHHFYFESQLRRVIVSVMIHIIQVLLCLCKCYGRSRRLVLCSLSSPTVLRFSVMKNLLSKHQVEKSETYDSQPPRLWLGEILGIMKLKTRNHPFVCTYFFQNPCFCDFRWLSEMAFWSFIDI